MDLQEVLNKVKSDLGEDAFNLISGKFTELNEESKQRRQKNSELSGTLNSLSENLGLDKEQNIVEQLTNLVKSKEEKAKSSMTELEKLQFTVNNIQEELSESKKLAAQKATEAMNAKRDNELINALNNSNVSKDLLPFVKDSLEKKIKVENDGFIFSDGETNYNSISEGVSSFVEKNPHLQVIQNAGGSGEKNSLNQNEPSRTVSRSDFGANLEAIARGEKVVSG